MMAFRPGNGYQSSPSYSYRYKIRGWPVQLGGVSSISGTLASVSGTISDLKNNHAYNILFSFTYNVNGNFRLSSQPNKFLYHSPPKYAIIPYSQCRQYGDSSSVALFGDGKGDSMNTLEILTLLLVVFAALTYIDNHNNRK